MAPDDTKLPISDVPVPGQRTNYGRIADSIRNSIFSGEFAQGSRLKVQELSERFDISTNPIREALQQLQGEGLIDIKPNKGAVVRVLDRTLVESVFDIREALDGLLSRRAATRATPEAIEAIVEIDNSLKASRAAGDRKRTSFFSTRFHEYIGEVAGNLEAVKVRRTYSNLFQSIRTRYGHTSGRIPLIEAEHQAIIDAIVAHDPDAAEQAARIHAQNSKIATLLVFDPQRAS